MKLDGPILLALDIDEVYKPICDERHSAIDSDMTALISDTTSIDGIVVAIETVLDADDIAHVIDVQGAYLVASDGMDIRGPDGAVLRQAPPLTVSVPSSLRREIGASGLRLRENRYSIALHWCGVPYDAISPLAEAFCDWAAGEGLDVTQASCGVEARSPGGSKQEAVRWLTRAIRAARVIYAGNECGDIPSGSTVESRGRNDLLNAV